MFDLLSRDGEAAQRAAVESEEAFERPIRHVHQVARVIFIRQDRWKGELGQSHFFLGVFERIVDRVADFPAEFFQCRCRSAEARKTAFM